MNQDEAKGKAKDIKGRVEEGAGAVTGNEHMREKGQADQAKGGIQEAWGKGKRRVGEALEDAGDKLD